MALRLIKNHLINLNSKQTLFLSSKCLSKDVSVDKPSDDRIKHEEVVYDDGNVKMVEKRTHTKQVIN